MDYDSIFEAYYRQYRAVSTIPTSTDAEYTIGLSLANEALSRWESYDNTFWQALYTTPQNEGEASTITTSQTQYEAPDNFKSAGGDIKILDANGNTFSTYKLTDPEKTQFLGDNSQYSFFMGNPSDGYTLNLNPAPESTLSGLAIKYIYYKSATPYVRGSDISEIPKPYFIVHRMLANRFRASRNPYYTDALRDAEDVLRTMQMENNSGTWANPISINDTSGTRWGD